MVTLRVTGAVAQALDLSTDDLAALPDQVPDVGALVPGRAGAGVRLRAILERAQVEAGAAYVTLASSDGFSICVPRAGVAEGIVAYRLGAGALPERDGGPLRFYVGRDVACEGGPVDACANVKRLVELHLSPAPRPDTHRH